MANYSIVSNAKFTPFSFNEMVAPFQMYGEYYAQQEQLASKLAEEAALWGQKANATTDPVTYEKYRSFEEDLNRQADRLLRQGMSPGLRSDLQKMKTRYATDINPIKDAYTWKVQQIQNQAEGKAKGIVYEGDAATTSLDDYINNPTLIYNSADSNAGFTRIATAAQAISKGLSEAKINGNLDKYTKKLLIRNGYNVSDVTSAVSLAMSDLEGVLNGTISMDSPAGNIVKELLQNESRASGIVNWENAGSRQEYLSKVSPALYNLVGQTQVTPIDDFASRSKTTHDYNILAIQEQGNQARSTQSEAHTKELEILDKKLGLEKLKILAKVGVPGTSTKSSTGGSGSYAYDRPNVAYSGGKTVTIVKNTDGTYTAKGAIDNLIGSNSDLDLTNYNSLNVKIEGTTVKIYYDGKELASYDTSTTNQKDEVTISDDVKDTEGNLTGILEDVKLDDIKHLARRVVENPGSENQYIYGVKEGVLFSLQNEAQRVTKDINHSNDQLNLLLQSIGVADSTLTSNDNITIEEILKSL